MCYESLESVQAINYHNQELIFLSDIIFEKLFSIDKKKQIILQHDKIRLHFAKKTKNVIFPWT